MNLFLCVLHLNPQLIDNKENHLENSQKRIFQYNYIERNSRIIAIIYAIDIECLTF